LEVLLKIESELLFTYGTLRPPQPYTSPEDSRYYPAIADLILAHQPATLAGGVLYDLGAYPAARPGAGILYGDLLHLDPAALPIADRIEGHPTFFQRKRVTVQTGDGNIEAWIYWAPAGLVVGKPLISGGDWFGRQDAKEGTMDADININTTDQPAPDPVLQSLVQRFAEANCCWLSSVRPDGRAHSAPVWHVWQGGRAYVVTTANAVKVKNIEGNPNVVISHPEPMDPVII